MTRFWFAVSVVVLMAAYQAMLTAVSSHIVGYELPPLAVFVIVSVSPVLLMIANALPSLYSVLPGASGNVPLPPSASVAMLAPLARPREEAPDESKAPTPA
jgi:hypothetical protein